MNVYKKLAKARAMLKSEGLKQSGSNKFAGYKYFELGDFLPSITKIEMRVGILSCVTFGKEEATLTVYNTDEWKEAEQIVFKTPMSTANLKGCHEVQNLGAVETYIRRYLYNTAYEIVECDALNATSGKDENKPVKAKKSEPAQENAGQANGAQGPAQKPVQSMAKLTLGEIVKLGFKDSARVATWLCKQYGVENLSDLSDEDTEEARAFVQRRAQQEKEIEKAKAKALQDADGDIPFPMDG